MADQLADAVEKTAKAAIREAGELGTAAGGALAKLSTEQLGRKCVTGDRTRFFHVLLHALLHSY